MSKQLLSLFTQFVAEVISEETSLTHEQVEKIFSDKDIKKKFDSFITENKISQKKEKKIKDSNEPKRAPSAYILFCKDERKNISVQNPTFNNKQVTSELGKQWKVLQTNDTEKFNKYKEVASEKKSQYEEEMAQYRRDNNLPEKIIKVSRPKVDRPEKAQTPFFYFLKDMTEEILAENPNTMKKDINEMATKKWKKIKAEKDEEITYKEIFNKYKRDRKAHV